MDNNERPGIPADDADIEDVMFTLLEEEPLSQDTISAWAGDRELTSEEKADIERRRTEHGSAFYSDLLYGITHQAFRPETAEELWYKILGHKYTMSALLGRNVKIAVAALDYLSNISHLVSAATMVSEQQFREFVRLANHDSLTGLFNHSYCFQRLDVELKRYARYGDIVSFMMIDVDHFKSYNDQYGHPEGDVILGRLGGFIDAETRECDVCCRYGGEEFSVISPSTDLSHAESLAQRLCSRVEEGFHNHSPVTISIGVASCGDGAMSSNELVKKADTALYEAKRRGRNGVVAAR